MLPNIKPCAREGCFAPAVGVSRWNPTEKPETRYCRDDYLDLVLGERGVVAEVTGPFEITDVRTQTGVGLGGLVELDPRQSNVTALVYAGHVKVVTAPKKAKPAESKG
jgi:hypothetical protein